MRALIRLSRAIKIKSCAVLGMEPPSKRLRLSLEPLPEKRIAAFFDDGKEVDEEYVSKCPY